MAQSQEINNYDNQINIIYTYNIVVETTAGGGGNIGGTFTELSEIIRLVEDKTRIGICIDTCHIFAAGEI